MTSKIALYAVAVLAVGGLGQGIAARADGLDPIAIRQVGMDLANGDFAFIRAVVAAKSDVKPLEAPGKALARWGRTIPAVFPAGSEKGENTKALPEIWSDRAGFEKTASDMQEAATKLADAAKAGDAETVAAQAKLLGDACGACHRHYRAK
jgi:cytochrome c556